MTPLESKLRALVARWRGATKAFSADGASRSLEWEGKDILRLCADELESLLAERQEPPTTREIECKVILRLMGNELYLGKGHVEAGGEFRWTVIADRISVEALAAAPSSGSDK